MSITHHPHLVVDQCEKSGFTGSVEFFWEHGKLTKLIRHETVTVGPLPLTGLWPPARETRVAEPSGTESTSKVPR